MNTYSLNSLRKYFLFDGQTYVKQNVSYFYAMCWFHGTRHTLTIENDKRSQPKLSSKLIQRAKLPIHECGLKGNCNLRSSSQGDLVCQW